MSSGPFASKLPADHLLHFWPSACKSSTLVASNAFANHLVHFFALRMYVLGPFTTKPFFKHLVTAFDLQFVSDIAHLLQTTF
jgi:hypothetical protein